MDPTTTRMRHSESEGLQDEDGAVSQPRNLQSLWSFQPGVAQSLTRQSCHFVVMTDIIPMISDGDVVQSASKCKKNILKQNTSEYLLEHDVAHRWQTYPMVDLPDSRQALVIIVNISPLTGEE